MKNLAKASRFGAIDADNDDLLLDSFEDHPAFQALVARDRFLIVGRKGAGKTAIFKKLITIDEPTIFTFGHTFSDYPWHHHALQARVGIPDFDKYTHSWKYLILITLAKILLNQDQSIPFDEASLESSSRLERFIIDTYGSRDPDVTQVFTPTKKLRLKPTFEIDIGLLRSGVSPESVPMEQLPTVVAEVNQNLTKWLLECLNPAHKYFACFDQLDLGFDPDDSDYRDRLIGLLLAARDINQAARDAGKQTLVAVFLRDDIYDGLHFEDNKFRWAARNVIRGGDGRDEFRSGLGVFLWSLHGRITACFKGDQPIESDRRIRHRLQFTHRQTRHAGAGRRQ